MLKVLDEALVAVEYAAAGLMHGGLEGGEIEVNLLQARDKLVDLRAGLENHVATPLATSLRALYAFCVDRLEEVEETRDPRPLIAVCHVIAEIRTAWLRGASTLQSHGPEVLPAVVPPSDRDAEAS